MIRALDPTNLAAGLEGVEWRARLETVDTTAAFREETAQAALGGDLGRDGPGGRCTVLRGPLGPRQPG